MIVLNVNKGSNGEINKHLPTESRHPLKKQHKQHNHARDVETEKELSNSCNNQRRVDIKNAVLLVKRSRLEISAKTNKKMK